MTRNRTAAFAVLGAVVVLAGACSSSSGSKGADSTEPSTAAVASSTTSTAPPVARPAGPAANLAHELTGGKGPFMGAGTPEVLTGTGYVEHEYEASGTATSYQAKGALTANGRWTFTPADRAPYRTRILVRRPAKAADFSGTVVVEWLNVSGGIDADPEWTSLSEEIIRAGDAWVGVSSQHLGIEGGPVLVTTPIKNDAIGAGLKKIDPARYGSLTHPGDGYSFDMFTQVARALRAGGTPLGGQTPQRILAAGESQSAFALTTYVDGVQPLTKAFDGFFVHSRGASGLPLAKPGQDAGIAGALGGVAAIFRTDQAVPVLDVQSESDVAGILNSGQARQPDSDRFRLWEVAGTAHADVHLVGAAGAAAIKCGVQINNGAMHIVAKAALASLDEWVRAGKLPPSAPRLELTAGTQPAVRRNADGIALGGVRTPLVDVPVDAVSGAPGPVASTICILLGSTTPLSKARVARLYPSRAVYLQRFGASADAAIKAGFVRPADRVALMAFAQPDRVTP
jgi:Alpha/beta hydrolase domain